MSTHDKANILLVDDQPGKLLSYEAILSDLGENLIKASSGREALEQLLKNDITVVLIDVSMPELDGFELAQIIREHPRYQKTAIIFVSAVHLTDTDRLMGYERGAVDYVSVPIVPELLRAKVSVFTELYRKRREADRLTRELEQRVAARTAELKEAIARQTELAEELRVADRRKDEFLALLAHELRNPLAPLRNAINILRLKESQDAEVLWCRGVIERQATQLTRLVDDLLDVSRITLGKIKLRPQPLELGTVIARAVETSRPQIDAHRHELLITLPEVPVRVEGDRARLTQVIANLLNNAAKYQNDCGTIALTVEREAAEAVIRVRDRGIGIAPEMLSEIFQLFAQGERTLDRAQGGLGIGLSLVKTVVELHGGRVSAASDGPGRGSEFSIRLPCLLEELDGYRDRAEEDQAEVPECAPLRILVVDDSRDAAESLTRLLRLGGHEVLIAREGEHALHLAATQQPSVVLLDIGLPGLDGYEICRRLRQSGLTNALIVAMTGYGLERDRRRSQEAGFDTHLVKPVPPEELLRMMAQHSNARRSSAGLPTGIADATDRADLPAP
ncbi:MAG TPA: response regulator [Gemmatimonadales bacterium]|jgi:signal transduction histidine kinase|nr:response regulator [Gemmatimonadales bacterium]